MSHTFVPRWLIVLGATVVLIGLMAFVLAIAVGYIGDEYVSPPFSESSVPPARPK